MKILIKQIITKLPKYSYFKYWYNNKPRSKKDRQKALKRFLDATRD